ncbi:MAG: hypothetical protein ACK4RZ_03590 [Paracoccaceae bacterium]
MRQTSAIDQIPVGNPHVVAFHILGKVCAEDLKAMATTIIRMMDKIIPVNARTFYKRYQCDALRFVAAQPVSECLQLTVCTRNSQIMEDVMQEKISENEALRKKDGVIDQRQQQIDPAGKKRADRNETAKGSQKQPGGTSRPKGDDHDAE